MMIKPNFLIIGSAKSGTTTLHHMLSKHSDIFISPKKDFQYFDNDNNYQRGEQWYKCFFDKANDEKLVGEANSEYLFSKNAAARIKKDLGEDVKLLAIIRDPAERSFSEYRHQVLFNETEKDFPYFLKKKNIHSEHDKLLFDRIIGRSNYSVHFAHYFDIFSKESIKVVQLERLKENPQKVLQEIFNFLGVKEEHIELVRENKAYIPKIKWLNDLVLQPNLLRKILKTIIPSFTIREKIRKKLRSVNASQSQKTTTLTRKQYDLLWSTYFYDDQEKLKDLLGFNLEKRQYK